MVIYGSRLLLMKFFWVFTLSPYRINLFEWTELGDIATILLWRFPLLKFIKSLVQSICHWLFANSIRWDLPWWSYLLPNVSGGNLIYMRLWSVSLLWKNWSIKLLDLSTFTGICHSNIKIVAFECLHQIIKFIRFCYLNWYFSF